MTITSNQKTDTNTVQLEIAVGAEELKAATDLVFKRKVKSITVPGFRKGKAPRQIIEKMYGEGIFLEDAVNDLYPKAYNDAIEEAAIDPVDRADIEILTLDKETGFTFKATVTVKPEIKVDNYKGIATTKTIYGIDEKDVDAEISRLQERNSRIVTVEERAAKLGDTTIIDFEGFVDDVAFDGGKAENHTLELGSHSFIDGFEDEIVGHSTGEEFDVNVTFPEEYHAEELKGKPAVFKVKLHEIKEKQMPEIDDEFAKDVSEYDTVDELKASIRDNLTKTREKRSEDEMETRLMEVIVENLEGEIPPVMFENKANDMARDFAYRLQSQGMQLDLYLQYTGMDQDAFMDSFKEQAERQVKMRLALEAIAAQENIVPTAEDLEEEYKRLAEMYGMEVDAVKGAITDKDVADDLACNKAIDLVKASAVVTEITEEEEKAKSEAEAKKEEEAEEKAAEKPKKTRKTTKKKDEASDEVADEAPAADEAE